MGMIDIKRKPDDIKIVVGNSKEICDAKVKYEEEADKLRIYLSADIDEPEYICLRWNHILQGQVRVLGDVWERSYADLSWKSLSCEDFMPWYFLADCGEEVIGCGVMVQPNSFVSFQCDSRGVTGWFDVRCGAKGIQLNGRELHVADVVCEAYRGISAFEAAKAFCKIMSPAPMLPNRPVYGSNNWYYAYGKSSGEEIRRDAAIVAELAGENENQPFMVIDDGWSVNSCSGPWLPNERFQDMKQIADDFKAMGVRPGIWFRPLHDHEAEEQHPEWRINRGGCLCGLDPSRPEVKQYIRQVLESFSDWGYELIKHDFTTMDAFGDPGNNLNGMITRYKDWSFYDRTKTSAEIMLDLFRLIREAAQGMLILSCNAVSHLCAGLAEINRIGDDTSGKNWCRTRGMGVNTLAFRLPQNGTFYMIDADCVGILEENIPWELNKQWLNLLAKSGSPLFISVQPSALTEEIREDIKEAYRINSLQKDIAEPLDWIYNNEPAKWKINGEEVQFDWIMEEYPIILPDRRLPA